MKVIRWAGYMTYLVNRDSKKRMMKPEELLNFNEPEVEKVLDLPTQEEMQVMKKRFS